MPFESIEPHIEQIGDVRVVIDECVVKPSAQSCVRKVLLNPGPDFSSLIGADLAKEIETIRIVIVDPEMPNFTVPDPASSLHRALDSNSCHMRMTIEIRSKGIEFVESIASVNAAM